VQRDALILLWPVVCVFGGLRGLLGMGTLGNGVGVMTFGIAVSLDPLVGHVWRLG
jgi:hypothetical protein